MVFARMAIVQTPLFKPTQPRIKTAFDEVDSAHTISLKCRRSILLHYSTILYSASQNFEQYARRKVLDLYLKLA